MYPEGFLTLKLSSIHLSASIRQPRSYHFLDCTHVSILATKPFSDSEQLSVLTYIELSATTAGIDPKFDVYFLAVANASSFFGRVLSGFLSDRLGKSTELTDRFR
jgi:hypothetical protein